MSHDVDLQSLGRAPRETRIDRDRTLFRLSLIFRDRAEEMAALALYQELMRLNDEEDAERFAALRRRLRDGSLRGPALLETLKQHVAQTGDIDLEEAVERALGIRTPRDAHVGFTGGRAAHMPSRTDHLLQAFEMGDVGPTDRLLDLGSGAGKAVFIAHLVFGASARGVEYRADLVARSEQARLDLGLESVAFEANDVRDADFGGASVFYLFNPFDIGTTTTVLRKMGEVASQNDVRIITLNNTLEAPWLEVTENRDAITCYRSTRRA